MCYGVVVGAGGVGLMLAPGAVMALETHPPGSGWVAWNIGAVIGVAPLAGTTTITAVHLPA